MQETRTKQEKENGIRKPIWITELGWPVIGNEAPLGGEAPGAPVEEDGHHLLVSASKEAELLTSTFNVIKSRSGPTDFNIKALFYYDIKDNANGVVNGPGEEGAQTWDNHCGLIEDLGGDGNGHGQKRPAWAAFKAETE